MKRAASAFPVSLAGLLAALVVVLFVVGVAGWGLSAVLVHVFGVAGVLPDLLLLCGGSSLLASVPALIFAEAAGGVL